MDCTGLDVQLNVANALFSEFKDASWAPPPLLKRMVVGGLLGVTSGRGFYDYDEDGHMKKRA